MRVMTIGMSPYNLTAHSKLNAWILRHLFENGFSMMGLVWGHEVNYFVPDEKGRHFYEFGGHKIPIIPIQRGTTDVVDIYEAINALKPEIVITVGDILDFTTMKAVKMFTKAPFRWLGVLANYQHPLNDEQLELLEDLDGLLCTSPAGTELVKARFHGNLTTSFVGCELDFQPMDLRDPDVFRIAACGRNLQCDNLATIMHVAAQLRPDIPNLELYVHASLYTHGDYDLAILKERLDPKDEFIRFPAKYVSLFDGIPAGELALELQKSDLFVSVPFVSATSLTVFEAMACGCCPIMSDCGSNQDLAREIEKHSSGAFPQQNLLVRTIPLTTVGETYLSVCDPDNLREKIHWAFKNRERIEGYRGGFSVITQRHNRGMFLRAVLQLVEQAKAASQVLCLETV